MQSIITELATCVSRLDLEDWDTRPVAETIDPKSSDKWVKSYLECGQSVVLFM